MSVPASAAHVSIGDVLKSLRDEFPDVTVSKIRFLESQGLIEPERTPSGYRKFYASDIERLRWVLREQKDHFLPLKVIKERLDEIDRRGGLGAAGAGAADGEPGSGPEASETGDGRGAAVDAFFAAARGSRDGTDGVVTREEAAASPERFDVASTGVSLTRAELAEAAGLDDAALASLEEYGLVRPTFVARERALFDEDALAVARVAAGFLAYGVEARHLRMYVAFAEREAGLFEQLLLPHRRRRNPEAQERVVESLTELAGLGRKLRAALLQHAMRRSAGG